jgi:hypothetical protein
MYYHAYNSAGYQQTVPRSHSVIQKILSENRMKRKKSWLLETLEDLSIHDKAWGCA